MSKAKIAAIITSGVLALGAVAPMAHAAALTEAQISAILGLLTSFGADAATIANVNASLRGQAAPNASGGGSAGDSATPGASTGSSGSACVTLTANLYQGSSGPEVSKLQTFLGGSVTGYFGPATLGLVQSWQASHGVASAGVTGYGSVGPKTRAAMACSY